MTSKDTPPSENESENSTQDPVEKTDTNNERQSSPPKSPFDIIATYRYFRDFIVYSLPIGRFLWDVTRICTAVILISTVLFFLTGLSTPFVAVSSGSMETNIMTGDLMIITDHNPDDPPFLSQKSEIITTAESQSTPGSHTSFNEEGDVIVFQQTEGEIPILHRAHFWVEDGENWVDNTNSDSNLLPPGATCESITQCPAQHEGYITAGDNNQWYDQASTRPPVKESEIIGVGQYRVPYLGWVRIGINTIT